MGCGHGLDLNWRSPNKSAVHLMWIRNALQTLRCRIFFGEQVATTTGKSTSHLRRFNASGIMVVMVVMVAADPVIEKVRSALAGAYGRRLERIVLYGSRARGDANSDSDYDIAVFVEELTGRWQEFLRLADIELAILEETGAIVHAMPYPARSWTDPSSPLMHEIRNDGIDL